MARKLPPIFNQVGTGAGQPAQRPKQAGWAGSGTASPRPEPLTRTSPAAAAPEMVAAGAAVCGMAWLFYMMVWGLAPTALPNPTPQSLAPATVVIEPLSFDGVRRAPTWDELFSVYLLENELRNVSIRRNQGLTATADVGPFLNQPLTVGRSVRIYLVRPSDSSSAPQAPSPPAARP